MISIHFNTKYECSQATWSNYNTTFRIQTFICPNCNTICEVHEDMNNSTHTLQVVHVCNRFCELEEYLYFSDDKWEITNIKLYKKKLRNFFNSDEYTTIIKQGLLKAL